MNFRIFVLQEEETPLEERDYTNIFIFKRWLDEEPEQIFEIMQEVMNRKKNKPVVIIGSDEESELVASYLDIE